MIEYTHVNTHFNFLVQDYPHCDFNSDYYNYDDSSPKVNILQHLSVQGHSLDINLF